MCIIQFAFHGELLVDKARSPGVELDQEHGEARQETCVIMWCVCYSGLRGRSTLITIEALDRGAQTITVKGRASSENGPKKGSTVELSQAKFVQDVALIQQYFFTARIPAGPAGYWGISW